MTKVLNLINLGMSPELSQMVATDSVTSADQATVGTGIVAAGSTLAGATVLTNKVNDVITVTTGQGVRLPLVDIGVTVSIRNNGAGSLSVYPVTASQTINGGSAGAAVTMTTGTSATYTRTTTLNWVNV